MKGKKYSADTMGRKMARQVGVIAFFIDTIVVLIGADKSFIQTNKRFITKSVY